VVKFAIFAQKNRPAYNSMTKAPLHCGKNSYTLPVCKSRITS